MIWTELQSILDAIDYKPGWSLRRGIDGDRLDHPAGGADLRARPWIQVVGETLHAPSGTPYKWRGGKVFLSWHMCRQEVVSACFAAFLKAEEHEAREWFRYRDAAIFNPHIDPDALVEIARRRSVRT